MDTIQIRNAEDRDIGQLVRVDREAFSGLPEYLFFTKDHFRAWLEVFPEGFFVACLEERVIGYASVQIIRYDLDNPVATWCEATDSGFIRKTHNPCGNAVYGVSICVSGHASGARIGKKLMFAGIRRFSAMKHIQYGVVVSRVPGYYKVVDQIPIQKYVFGTRESGRPIDPLLNFYVGCGFRIARVMSDYIEDPPSRNYGVLMAFSNPNYDGGS